MPVVNCTPHSTAIIGSTPLRPDLFEFRADRGVFEDAGTDPAEDTDPVYQWSDQGPASRFATQATLANRPTLSSAASPNYLSLDGSDDRMSFGGTDVLAATGSAWSVEFYVRLTDFASTIYPTILSVRSTAEPFNVGFSNDANYLGVHFGSQTVWSPSKTGTAAASLTGSDRHVIVTYNGGGSTTRTNFTTYIDGVLQTLTASFSFPAITNGSSIGSKFDNTHPWKGRLYRAAGFSRELTQLQVSERFALGRNG